MKSDFHIVELSYPTGIYPQVPRLISLLPSSCSRPLQLQSLMSSSSQEVANVLLSFSKRVDLQVLEQLTVKREWSSTYHLNYSSTSCHS
jgi:hypothetical protein